MWEAGSAIQIDYFYLYLFLINDALERHAWDRRYVSLIPGHAVIIIIIYSFVHKNAQNDIMYNRRTGHARLGESS